MTDWPQRWFDVCDQVAGWSKDRSTKVGCVIVGEHNQILSSGYNGFPRGVYDDTDLRHQRPAKYMWTEHAERNAIYNAARHGVALEGSTLYIPWFPCAGCARAIIQSGIKRVICYKPEENTNQRWTEDIDVAHDMMFEASIDLIFMEAK